MYIHFYNVYYKNWLTSDFDLVIDVKNIIKLNQIDININKNLYQKSFNKVHHIIDKAFKDEEYDDKFFTLQIEDDVYEGPNRDLYGGIIENYEEEFYESASYFEENLLSPIHLFPPYLFDQFKEHVTKLYKTYFIYHNFNISILPDKSLKLEYIIRNCDFELDESNDILLVINFSQDMIIYILTLVYYYHPKVIATDIDCGCY